MANDDLYTLKLSGGGSFNAKEYLKSQGVETVSVENGIIKVTHNGKEGEFDPTEFLKSNAPDAEVDIEEWKSRITENEELKTKRQTDSITQTAGAGSNARREYDEAVIKWEEDGKAFRTELAENTSMFSYDAGKKFQAWRKENPRPLPPDVAAKRKGWIEGGGDLEDLSAFQKAEGFISYLKEGVSFKDVTRSFLKTEESKEYKEKKNEIAKMIYDARVGNGIYNPEEHKKLAKELNDIEKNRVLDDVGVEVSEQEAIDYFAGVDVIAKTQEGYIDALESRKEQGKELSEEEIKTLSERPDFMASMALAMDAIKEDPGLAGEEILIDFADNWAAYLTLNWFTGQGGAAINVASKLGKLGKATALFGAEAGADVLYTAAQQGEMNTNAVIEGITGELAARGVSASVGGFKRLATLNKLSKTMKKQDPKSAGTAKVAEFEEKVNTNMREKGYDPKNPPPLIDPLEIKPLSDLATPGDKKKILDPIVSKNGVPVDQQVEAYGTAVGDAYNKALADIVKEEATKIEPKMKAAKKAIQAEIDLETKFNDPTYSPTREEIVKMKSKYGDKISNKDIETTIAAREANKIEVERKRKADIDTELKGRGQEPEYEKPEVEAPAGKAEVKKGQTEVTPPKAKPAKPKVEVDEAEEAFVKKYSNWSSAEEDIVASISGGTSSGRSRYITKHVDQKGHQEGSLKKIKSIKIDGENLLLQKTKKGIHSSYGKPDYYITKQDGDKIRTIGILEGNDKGIEHFAVSEKYQNKGLGKILLEQGEKDGINILGTEKRTNEATRAMYRYLKSKNRLGEIEDFEKGIIKKPTTPIKKTVEAVGKPIKGVFDAATELVQTPGGVIERSGISAKAPSGRKIKSGEKVSDAIEQADIRATRLGSEASYNAVKKGLNKIPKTDIIKVRRFMEKIDKDASPEIKKVAELVAKENKKALEASGEKSSIASENYIPRRILRNKITELTDPVKRQETIDYIMDPKKQGGKKFSEEEAVDEIGKITFAMSDIGDAPLTSKQITEQFKMLQKIDPEKFTEEWLYKAQANAKSFKAQANNFFKQRKRAALPEEYYDQDLPAVMNDYYHKVYRSIEMKKSLGYDPETGQFDKVRDLLKLTDNERKELLEYSLSLEIKGGAPSESVFRKDARYQKVADLTEAVAPWSTKISSTLLLALNKLFIAKNVLFTSGTSGMLEGGLPLVNSLKAALTTLRHPLKTTEDIVKFGAYSKNVIKTMHDIDVNAKPTTWKGKAVDVGIDIIKTPLAISEGIVRAFGWNMGKIKAKDLLNDAMRGVKPALEKLQKLYGDDLVADAMNKGELSEAMLNDAGIYGSRIIGGDPRQGRTSFWFNTSEGRIMTAFKKTSQNILINQKKEVLDPMWQVSRTIEDFGDGSVSGIKKWFNKYKYSTAPLVNTLIASGLGGFAIQKLIWSFMSEAKKYKSQKEFEEKSVYGKTVEILSLSGTFPLAIDLLKDSKGYGRSMFEFNITGPLGSMAESALKRKHPEDVLPIVKQTKGLLNVE
jgi:hypothetical protein